MFKVAFNNSRSLHKHFPQVKSEPNILASDVVGFSETRLCDVDKLHNLQLQGYTATFNNEVTSHFNRRHHGTALYMYVKTDYTVTCISKFNNGSVEFISANVHLSQSRDVKVIVSYKYPSCSLGNF